jgi:hypothetical protein
MTRTVSVVIASFGGDQVLSGCLSALEPERGEAEVIAVGRFDDGRALSARFPWTTFLPAPSDANVFARRARGVLASHGERIALLEDHCRVAPGWLAALSGDGGTLAGPVCAEPRTLRDFALYLVEYSALLPPLTDEGGLLAVNAAYDRGPLFAHESVWRDGFYDNEVHDALRRAGFPARLARGAQVESRLSLPFPAACAHLFAGGRRFGGYRGGGRRRAVLVPLVPFVLAARILGRVLVRRRAWLPRALAASPLLVAFVCTWSAGELIGTLRGRRA